VLQVGGSFLLMDVWAIAQTGCDVCVVRWTEAMLNDWLIGCVASPTFHGASTKEMPDSSSGCALLLLDLWLWLACVRPIQTISQNCSTQLLLVSTPL
jgi:hypothetical protein